MQQVWEVWKLIAMRKWVEKEEKTGEEGGEISDWIRSNSLLGLLGKDRRRIGTGGKDRLLNARRKREGGMGA